MMPYKLSWTAKALLALAGLYLFATLLSGCVPGGMFMADPATMSTEQLEAYKQIGYRAVRCATVAGGPPVGGRVSSVTVPQDGKAEVTFGPDCSVQGVKLNP